MDKYQQNIDTEEIDNSEDIEFTIKSYPFIFSNNYDKYKYHENGNKIVLPKYILYEISKYKNISFPITLVCNNIYIGVLEFEEGQWKIAHYVLSIAVPNDRVSSLLELKKAQDSISIMRLKGLKN